MTHAKEETTFDQSTVDRAQAIIARYPQSRSALLPMLHLVQSVEGYVSQDGIRTARPERGRGQRGRDVLHDVQAPSVR